MNKIKIGIIGTGSIAGEHINAYLKNPDVELVAFCDINEDRVTAKAEAFGIKQYYTNADDMLKQADIDAVSVCTWNSAHAECAIKALNAGKHVLCEKPMALSEAQALKMKEAADKSGKLLMIGFVRRFGNDCATLKDFIDTDFMGDIYYAKATYLRRNGCPGGWFGDKSRSGGGPLIDLGVHVIDLVRYLCGNPKPVSVYGVTFDKLKDRPHIKSSAGGYTSQTTEEKPIFNVEDLASALIRFDNGLVLSIEAAFSLNIESDTGTVELFGTKAGAKLNPELVLYTENEGHLTNLSFNHSTALSFDGLFQNEINHFVDCVKNGKACKAPAQDGIELMRILDAVYKSAETGHEVIL